MRRERAVPRRLVVLGGLAVVAVGAGGLVFRRSSSASAHAAAATPSPPAVATVPARSSPSPTATPSATTVELPRGGRDVFPRYRLVGFCGAPGSAALGRLGVGRLDDRVNEIEKL